MSAMQAIDKPNNEPVLAYAPGSPERTAVQDALRALSSEKRDLPLIIDGKEVRPDKRIDFRPPHRNKDVVANLFQGGEKEVEQAIVAAMKARASWSATPFEERAAVLMRAAEMLAGRYRAKINAATMLGQSKTVHQAEIDSACELIDFFRFNVYFARKLFDDQPASSSGCWNRVDYRPLDGFVLAVTPFNFTAIGANLPTAPALMGNTVLWKPATTSALSNHIVMEILMEAGLPPGVINLVHAPGRIIGQTALKHPDLAGVHFTGSTGTFQTMWRTVGENIESYRSYPRLVGETGGKDFMVAHESADVEAMVAAIVRGAFEYQGQKCSALSRLYVPQGMWKEVSGRLEAEIKRVKVGDVTDMRNFMGAVIDANAYRDIKGYIDHARSASGGKVWLGGQCDDSEGYFIQPTVVLAEDPKHKLICEEIFGPVLSVYCYPDGKYEETLRLCDETSPYALTGAVFARDRAAIHRAHQVLRFAAGNFYVNDKPTGAVVGQQPFGGARASGTNDKAGSFLNLVRWTSARTVKETFDPPRSWEYPFLQADK